MGREPCTKEPPDGFEDKVPSQALGWTLLTQDQQTLRVIVSVHVRPDNPRHFGFSSRQRPTRTRGVITRCRKIDLAGIRSGSGESWFDPRRGNSTAAVRPPFSLPLRESALGFACALDPRDAIFDAMLAAMLLVAVAQNPTATARA